MERNVWFFLCSLTILGVLVPVLLNNNAIFRTSHINQKITFEINDTCKSFLRTYLKLQITEAHLNGLIDICKADGYLKDRIEFDIPVLNGSLNNLKCLLKPKTLFKSAMPLVALASFPGSGNTMTRMILESVTGISTVPNNRTVLCPSRGYAFIIKTHRSDDKAESKDCLKVNTHRLNYTKAIYILRNPYNALLAEYKRKIKGKIERGFTGNYFGAAWKAFAYSMSSEWKKMTIYWLKTFNKPVYLLVYENVLANRMTEVYSLVQFLNVNITLEQLLCTKSNYVERRKRTYEKWLSDISVSEIFDKNMRKCVNKIILSTMEILNLKALKEYILPEI